MVLAAFAEVISVGAVLPFLGVLTAPEKIYSHELASPLIGLTRAREPTDLLLPVTLLFVGAALLAGLVRIVLLSVQTRVAAGIGADFSVQVFERTLYQPYSVHVSRNSSEILAGSQKAKDLVATMISPMLQMAGSSLILVALMAALLAIHPLVALSALVSFSLIYFVVAIVSRRKVARNSKTMAFQLGKVTKAVQEGLGGIRDVLIDGTQRVYTNLYRAAFLPYQAAGASNQILGSAPRFGIEALGMVLIAGLAYALAADPSQLSAVAAPDYAAGDQGRGGSLDAIPVLGAMALGAQRLLPVLQQIYLAYVTLKGAQASASDALDLLDQPMPCYSTVKDSAPVLFEDRISLRDVFFRYSEQAPWVIKNLSIEISKGSRTGFIGATGSGKSTLLDIVMGLLSPTSGQLLIDNMPITKKDTRSWQAHLSHVPQTIYLADTSIAENIAFGVPQDKIDRQRVRDAAEKAQIAQTIESWSDGYDTLVGERGVRLSGGQRQRIGIARALYKQANVIILDEATSALDNDTEAAVMQTIEMLGREITVLIIAHRLTTLRNCDRIIELTEGSIKSIENYEQMIRRIS
jgi:ABC-type multidrug transport system fused ATPase/permease subunit